MKMEEEEKKRIGRDGSLYVLQYRRVICDHYGSRVSE
jgi:hypothetical protein